MAENRSKDIQMIKLSIQVEKDIIRFFENFLEKAGESSISPFIKEMVDDARSDLEFSESLLVPLEDKEKTENIEKISLDDYAKELHKTHSEKFFPPGKVDELFRKYYNPIRLLAFCSDTLKEISRFYTESAENIFYDQEKNSFQNLSTHKKSQMDKVMKKKKELISRFP